jgi:hypothetical protein
VSLGGWLGAGPHAPFFLFATGIVTAAVMRARRVTGDTVVGSLCAYLMICFAFASVFEGIEAASAGSFAGLEGIARDRLFESLAYFSLVTLTTLGYGDVTPVAATAQSLVILESVVGVLFPAVVVARLVAVYSGGSGRAFARSTGEEARRSRRVLALTVLLVAAILAFPWLARQPGARTLVGLGFAVMLAGGVFAITHQGRTVAQTLTLGVVAITARVLPWDVTALRIVGLVAEVAFFGWVIFQVGGWGLSQNRVNSGVLLSALCVFLLIGIGYSSAFVMIERILPGSLSTPEGTEAGLYLYFSFMTLTTTGFGDVTPVGGAASAVAMSESTLGIFFPAVVLARLVALYDAD